MTGASSRIMDFYSRTNEGFTRAELDRAIPGIGLNTIGSAMYRLYQIGKLERLPVKDSRHQAMKYYRSGALAMGNMPYKEAIRTTYIKPVESLI